MLDTAPVWQGSSSAQSLRNTIDLARRVERLGYTRFWVAEHHNTQSIASSSPPVLVAELANATSTLRIGSGGVMLPNHPPLVVAEQFGTLEALHPGRIDLGVGRAPGTDPITAKALRRTTYDVGGADFEGQVGELLAYFAEGTDREGTDREGTGDGIAAVPAPGNRPSIWLLGSSEESARLAGRLGLPYAYAHHINPANVGPALAAYRASFTPSAVSASPYVIVAALVIAADSPAKAEWLSSSLAMMILRMRDGLSHGRHTPPELAVRDHPPEVRRLVDEHLSARVIGGPDTVRVRVAELLDRTGANELMAITLIHDQDDRVRCYEILADAVATL